MIIIGIILLLFALSLLYEWLRRKTNNPKIGFKNFSPKMIKRDDYVCIDERVLRFNHWAQRGNVIDPVKPPSYKNLANEGDMGFDGPGLGYIYYPPSILTKCKFVYGKYGVKWALSDDWAAKAKEKVLNAH